MSRPVTAVLKRVSIFGSEVPDDMGLEQFDPPNPTHFGFQAQVFIGEPDDDLVDSFDIAVCSPSWFAEQTATDEGWDAFDSLLTDLPPGVLPGTGVWFMRRWDLSQFETALRVACASASGGPDWGSVASRIGRLLPWEYDYRYDAHVDSRYGESFPTQ